MNLARDTITLSSAWRGLLSGLLACSPSTQVVKFCFVWVFWMFQDFSFLNHLFGLLIFQIGDPRRRRVQAFGGTNATGAQLHCNGRGPDRVRRGGARAQYRLQIPPTPPSPPQTRKERARANSRNNGRKRKTERKKGEHEREKTKYSTAMGRPIETATRVGAASA